MCMQGPARPGDSFRSSGTGIPYCCLLPRGCWELNPGSLQEHPGLLELSRLSRPSLPLYTDVPGDGKGPESVELIYDRNEMRDDISV